MPTGLAMLLFIAFPLVSVVLQSVHTPHEAVLVTVENCGPFGCKQETTIDQDATRALRDAEPLGRFVGLDIYFCLLYTSPSPRDYAASRMPSSA